MASIAIVSFRLGGVDGVSIEATKWARAFENLGHFITYVAGNGPPSVRIIHGLDLYDEQVLDNAELERALNQADLVVVENMLSLPINHTASEALRRILRGRKAIIRHHDLALDRADTAAWWPPPTDPLWLHVAISPPVQHHLANAGIKSHLLWNHFDFSEPRYSRAQARQRLGIPETELLFLQPTRAIERKNIPRALQLAQEFGATYWLTGPAEDSYQSELDALLSTSTVKVRRGIDPEPIDLAYAASDLVLLPSTREGFGNPIIESIVQRRGLVLGHFPVSDYLRNEGFCFLDSDDTLSISQWLTEPNLEVLTLNRDLASPLFAMENLAPSLASLLLEVGI